MNLDDSEANSDRDYFAFTVSPGHVLEKILLSEFSSSNAGGYASIGLETGTAPYQESVVEFINWNGPCEDLLQFDSKPGPQSPGDYVVSLSYSESGIYNYSLRTTVVIAIPEPSSIGLCLIGSVLALC